MYEKDLKLLEESFKKYYFDHFDLIHVPDRPSEREFGYQQFNSGMTRHLTVKNDNELRLMLMNNNPSD
ncbi:MAG: DNA primase, partial [Nitrosopumilaceae archaeon]